MICVTTWMCIRKMPKSLASWISSRTKSKISGFWGNWWDRNIRCVSSWTMISYWRRKIENKNLHRQYPMHPKSPKTSLQLAWALEKAPTRYQHLMLRRRMASDIDSEPRIGATTIRMAISDVSHPMPNRTKKYDRVHTGGLCAFKCVNKTYVS
jgi:hypothetical protein